MQRDKGMQVVLAQRSQGQQLATSSIPRASYWWDLCVSVRVCAQCICELKGGLAHAPGNSDLERPKACLSEWLRSLTSSHSYYMDLIPMLLFEGYVNLLCL